MGKRRRKAVESSVTNRFVGYVRVSTDEQASSGLGLDAQRRAIAQYAELYGLEVVEVVADEGLSASTLRRAGLERVRAMLDRGEVAGVVIAKLDRLTRSVQDLGELVDAHFRDGQARLVSVADHIDTTSASGRLVLHVLASVSQWEREAIGERTAAAMASLRTQGRSTGTAPYGQRSEGGVLVPDDGEQSIIAEIIALDAEGLSTPKIAARLNKLGRPARGAKWYQPAVWRIVAAHRAASAA